MVVDFEGPVLPNVVSLNVDISHLVRVVLVQGLLVPIDEGPLLLGVYGRYHPRYNLDSPLDIIVVEEVIAAVVILVLVLLSNLVDVAYVKGPRSAKLIPILPSSTVILGWRHHIISGSFHWYHSYPFVPTRPVDYCVNLSAVVTPSPLFSIFSLYPSSI